MYCPYCGTQIDDEARECTACHRPIPAKGSVPTASPRLGDDPAMRILLPVGRSGLAIAAGYAGLFALLVVPAPVALILGILAYRDLKQNPEKRGMGRTVFGLVLGGLGTLLLIWILAAAWLGS